LPPRTASGDGLEDKAGDGRADGDRGDGGQDEPFDEGRLNFGDPGLDVLVLGFETAFPRLEIGLGRRPTIDEFGEGADLLGGEADGSKFEDGVGARNVLLSGSN
jgi:hypothetical protein